MTRMTGPDCAVVCNLINIHAHIHTHDIPIQSISDVKSRIFSLRSCNLEYIIIIIGHPIHCLLSWD